MNGTNLHREGTVRFLTTEAAVYVAIIENPTARLRDIAAQVGCTERTVMNAVTRLDANGFLTRSRDGRRNVYRCDTDKKYLDALTVVADLDAVATVF
jgi:DNA-binding MarR family transcriptional regulator